MDYQLSAQKKLRSFALFPSQKRSKYENAYILFGLSVNEYERQGDYLKMAENLSQQARLCINKLANPLQSSIHYLEATRAFMLVECYDRAIESLQLAVAARTKPLKKHNDKSYLDIPGITVTDGNYNVSPEHSHSIRHLFSSSSNKHNKNSPIINSTAAKKRLLLSPQVMCAQISDAPVPLDLGSSVLDSPNNPRPISLYSGGRHSESAAAGSSISGGNNTFAALSSFNNPTSSTTSSNNNSPPARARRHSISGPSPGDDSSTPSPTFIAQPLHVDLLLARLAVQLATDLWADLDWRDAIISLEIASTLFESLLSAEAHKNISFRASNAQPTHQITRTTSGILKRGSSLPVPPTPGAIPSAPSVISPPSSSTSGPAHAVEHLSALIRSHTSSYEPPQQPATTVEASSKSFAARPTTTAPPVPSFVQPISPDPALAPQIRHTQSPTLSVWEGEHLLDPCDLAGITILEESLVCKYQLANYYVTYDEDNNNTSATHLDESSNHDATFIEHQELRRAKALYESVAAAKPDIHLLHTYLLTFYQSEWLSDLSGPFVALQDIDHISMIIAQFTADDDQLINCLFLAGLCDALIHIRIYASKHAKPVAQISQNPALKSFISPVTTPTNSKAASAASSSTKSKLPPSVQQQGELLKIANMPSPFETLRVVECPPILHRYRLMCGRLDHQSPPPEIALLRQIYGLLHLAASLTQRISDMFGPAPHVAKNLFQAAMAADLLNEFTHVTQHFAKQRPLTSIASTLLIEIKAMMKAQVYFVLDFQIRPFFCLLTPECYCIVLCSALLSEGISWLLIYRTEEYKKLNRVIESIQAKVDKHKSISPLSLKKDGKSGDKKLKEYNDLLAEKQRDMTMCKMKSTVCLAFIMIGVYSFIVQLYDGIVVAKLPFHPISWVYSLSHRNLFGTDPTDCSATFIYILCTLSIRMNLQKLLGITPQTQGPSIWDGQPKNE